MKTWNRKACLFAHNRTYPHRFIVWHNLFNPKWPRATTFLAITVPLFLYIICIQSILIETPSVTNYLSSPSFFLVGNKCSNFKDNREATLFCIFVYFTFCCYIIAPWTCRHIRRKFMIIVHGFPFFTMLSIVSITIFAVERNNIIGRVDISEVGNISTVDNNSIGFQWQKAANQLDNLKVGNISIVGNNSIGFQWERQLIN